MLIIFSCRKYKPKHISHSMFWQYSFTQSLAYWRQIPFIYESYPMSKTCCESGKHNVRQLAVNSPLRVTHHGQNMWVKQAENQVSGKWTEQWASWNGHSISGSSSELTAVVSHSDHCQFIALIVCIFVNMRSNFMLQKCARASLWMCSVSRNRDAES